MPDFVLPYSPADGAVLVPDSLNKNLYELARSLGAGEASVYETANGNIEFANLVAGFKVRSHMVRPWQAGDAGSVGLTHALDYFENAWGKSQKWYGVAGVNFTFYQKYDLQLAQFFTSFFASIWRQRGKDLGGGSFGAPPQILVTMHIDGKVVDATIRLLPQTIYYSTTKTYGGGYDYSFSREERNVRYMNLHHTKIASGSPTNGTDQLLKGHHSFGLHIWVQQNEATGEELDIDGDAAETMPNFYYDAQHRVRLFVRHADVLRLL